MNTTTLPSYVLYTLVIGLIIIVGIFYLAMQDGNQCLDSPLIYGADKATTPETGGVRCSCSFVNPDYAPLYFSKDGMSIDPFFGNFRSDIIDLEE